MNQPGPATYSPKKDAILKKEGNVKLPKTLKKDKSRLSICFPKIKKQKVDQLESIIKSRNISPSVGDYDIAASFAKIMSG
jgi:hypothetical protein